MALGRKVVNRADRKRGDAGFTMVELLIAMVILGVGMLSIGLAQLSAIKLSARSSHLSQAMYLAQEQMEQFMVMPAGSAVLNNPVADAADPGGTLYVQHGQNDATSFSRRWTIEPNVPQPGMTRITVTVDWDSANSAVSQATLMAVRAP